MENLKKELGVHNQIGKHVGHYMKSRKDHMAGLRVSGMREFTAWHGASVGNLMET